jgi:hypothetical protein
MRLQKKSRRQPRGSSPLCDLSLTLLLRVAPPYVQVCHGGYVAVAHDDTRHVIQHDPPAEQRAIQDKGLVLAALAAGVQAKPARGGQQRRLQRCQAPSKHATRQARCRDFYEYRVHPCGYHVSQQPRLLPLPKEGQRYEAQRLAHRLHSQPLI